MNNKDNSQNDGPLDINEGLSGAAILRPQSDQNNNSKSDQSDKEENANDK